ncbi:MAG TPA: DUF3352 domain-containing protein [Spirochaetes bacterium]|nr:DUF3352 domain-containing protein [Spirochaetota bacterium]
MFLGVVLMKRLYFLMPLLLILLIQTNLFSLSRFAPNGTDFYIDFNIKNLDHTIKTIADKFTDTASFTQGYNQFKQQIIRSLNVDFTNEQSLKAIGIDLDRRSGFVLTEFSMRQPKFFIAIAVTNPGLCRDFLFKLYKKGNRQNKERILFFGNVPVNIIQKMTYNNKYKDDFVVVALEGYLLVSNEVETIKEAIGHFQSGQNLKNDPNFKTSLQNMNRDKQSIFMYMSGKFIETLQNFVTRFSQLSVTEKYKGLFKGIAAGISADDKAIIIKAYTDINPDHPMYSDLQKLYDVKPNKINLLDYLPEEKPVSIIKINFNIQSYLKRFLPAFVPQMMKEMDREMDRMTRRLNFDVRTNVVNNLGNYYNFVLYDYDANVRNMDSDKFINSLDFLAYGEVVNQGILESAIQVFVDKFTERMGHSNPKLVQENIEGIKFHSISKKGFKLYFGAYMNHFVIASRKSRLVTLINNVTEGTAGFLSQYEGSLRNELDHQVSMNFLIDIENAFDNQKIPHELLNAFNWNNLKYFHIYGGKEGKLFYSTIKLVFR